MERHLEPTEDIVVEVLRPEQVRTLLLKNEIIQATHAAPLWKYFAESLNLVVFIMKSIKRTSRIFTGF